MEVDKAPVWDSGDRGKVKTKGKAATPPDGPPLPLPQPLPGFVWHACLLMTQQASAARASNDGSKQQPRHAESDMFTIEGAVRCSAHEDCRACASCHCKCWMCSLA